VAKPAKELVPSSHGLMEERHGMKVIQPLEPIVPPKEEFARELAGINNDEPKAKPPKLPEQPVEPKEAVKPARPVEKKVEAAPQEPAASPAIVKHSGEMLPELPESATEGAASDTADFETAIPQSESLAADDVAKARAEREAQAALKKAKPAPEKAPEDQGGRHKRKRMRDRDRKPESSPQSDTLAGKLIMPTGEKPEAAEEPKPQERPKQLAPGEVYVDEAGNVIIGE